MPNNYLKKLAKDKSRNIVELEKDWERAKELAKEQGHEDDFGYITAIFKKVAKIEESKWTLVKEISEGL
jgi:hypothetical protein